MSEQIAEALTELNRAADELRTLTDDLQKEVIRLEQENVLYREYYDASEAYANLNLNTTEQMEAMTRFRAAESALHASKREGEREHLWWCAASLSRIIPDQSCNCYCGMTDADLVKAIREEWSEVDDLADEVARRLAHPALGEHANVAWERVRRELIDTARCQFGDTISESMTFDGCPGDAWHSGYFAAMRDMWCNLEIVLALPAE